MKKNIKRFKILFIILLMMTLTGCTKTFNYEGSMYTENILCQPEKIETKKVYEKNKIDISELPKCSNFEVFKDYEGIFNTLFVKPLAWLLINIGGFLNSYGLAIIIVTILLRILVMPITAKTLMQSENMKKAKPDLDKLEKKYKNKNDRDSMMQKSQEQLLIYKKHNIKPLSGCIFAFIQIPLFFAFFESINRVPLLFEENFLGLFELRRSPLEAFQLNQYYYVIFIILIILTTYFSFKSNKSAGISQEYEKQMKLMMNIMIIFISVISISLSTGIGLYWIVNSSFTIFQNLIIKRGIKNDNNP